MIRQLSVCLVTGLSLCLLGEASGGLPIHLPQNASYQYINATAATSIGAPPANWFEPAFVPSGWFSGAAPFANSASIHDLANATGPDTPDVPLIPHATTWDEHFDPYLRTAFTLSAPKDLTLWLAVDNGVESIYLNGYLGSTVINFEGEAFRWEHVIDIPSFYTQAGTNTLALQLEDHGSLTGFALVITDDDPPENPKFPEPTAVATLGCLGMLLTLRRR
jgi:hypothetical protein